jgi:predicted anti-sigma-YlaC factor YlaD
VIRCDDFMAELGNLLEGDVAAEVRHHLEEHLAHCQTCHVIYDSSRQALKIVTDSGSFDLPEAASRPIAAKIMARIRETGGR